MLTFDLNGLPDQGVEVLTPIAALGDVDIECMKKDYGFQPQSKDISGRREGSIVICKVLCFVPLNMPLSFLC